MKLESDFNPHATSPVGAIGLTQVMPATARFYVKGITREGLYDPNTNLRVGFRYLRGLVRRVPRRREPRPAGLQSRAGGGREGARRGGQPVATDTTASSRRATAARERSSSRSAGARGQPGASLRRESLSRTAWRRALPGRRRLVRVLASRRRCSPASSWSRRRSPRHDQALAGEDHGFRSPFSRHEPLGGRVVLLRDAAERLAALDDVRARTPRMPLRVALDRRIRDVQRRRGDGRRRESARPGRARVARSSAARGSD